MLLKVNALMRQSMRIHGDDFDTISGAPKGVKLTPRGVTPVPEVPASAAVTQAPTVPDFAPFEAAETADLELPAQGMLREGNSEH